MKTCCDCANFECQNFFGVGKCTKEGMLAYFEDEACEDFVELPDDADIMPNILLTTAPFLLMRQGQFIRITLTS